MDRRPAQKAIAAEIVREGELPGAVPGDLEVLAPGVLRALGGQARGVGLVALVEGAKDDKAVTEIGIEWCIRQSKELKAAGVPCLHYYTMGDAETVRRIVSAVV